MRKKLVLISSIILVLILLGAAVLVRRAFYGGYYVDTKISDQVLIDAEPLIIESNGRLRILKDKQFISIVLDNPLELDTSGKGIKLPNGEVINPYISLRDQDGVNYDLDYAGGRRVEGEMIANYSFKESFPYDTEYKSVTLRSDTPILVKRVLWSGYDIRDLP